MTAATEKGLREARPLMPDAIKLELGLKVNLNIRQRSCTDVDFNLLTDGKLAGRVTTSDGKPASFAKVAIIPTSPVHPQFTVDADENGYFEIAARQPGQYLSVSDCWPRSTARSGNLVSTIPVCAHENKRK